MKCALVIPVKTFSSGKSRLASDLTLFERKNFIVKSLKNSIDVAKRSKFIDEILIVSNSKDMADIFINMGLKFCYTTNTLNRALEQSVQSVASHVDNIIISAADLANVISFEPIIGSLGYDRIVLCPDRHRNGTNIIAHKSQYKLSYSFGANSFIKHLSSVSRLASPIEILQSSQYSLDVDTIHDLKLSELMKN